MHEAQFKIAARSVGYRMGKSLAERQRYRKKDEYMPNFSLIFTSEYAAEAERGYDAGIQFIRTQDQNLRERRINS